MFDFDLKICHLRRVSSNYLNFTSNYARRRGIIDGLVISNKRFLREKQIILELAAVPKMENWNDSNKDVCHQIIVLIYIALTMLWVFHSIN